MNAYSFKLFYFIALRYEKKTNMKTIFIFTDFPENRPRNHTNTSSSESLYYPY